MVSSPNFRGCNDVDRLQALLTVAQTQAQRSRIAITRLEIEAINDYACLSLASAILRAKDSTGFTWGNLIYNLNQPCSEQMLRKIAYRSKIPSYKLFCQIHDALLTLANKRGFELPKIETMRQFN